MKFNLWKYLRCLVTLNHIDPVVTLSGDNLLCKRCGRTVLNRGVDQ